MEIFVRYYSTTELFDLVSGKLAKHNVPQKIVCAIVRNMFASNEINPRPVNIEDFCDWFSFGASPEGFKFWNDFAKKHNFWEEAV